MNYEGREGGGKKVLLARSSPRGDQKNKMISSFSILSEADGDVKNTRAEIRGGGAN